MARVDIEALEKQLLSVKKSIKTLEKKRDKLKDQIDDALYCKKCNAYQSEMIFKNIHHWGVINKGTSLFGARCGEYGEGISATLICPECGEAKSLNFTSSWRGAGKNDKEFDDIVYETTELTSRNPLVGRWWKGEWDAVCSRK
jgi:rubredoxin